MRRLLLLLIPLLLLSACSPERSPRLVLPAFWNHAGEWVRTGSEKSAREACEFVSSRALRRYDGDCQSALRDILPRKEIGDARPVRSSRSLGQRGLWEQPVLLEVGGEVFQATSVAPLHQGEILSLAGLSVAVLRAEDRWNPRDAAVLDLLHSQ